MLAGMTGGCRLDQLVRPPGPSRLVVVPPALTDSALSGSAEMSRDLSVQVEGTGMTWRAATARGSNWIALQQTEAAGTAMLTLSLAPGSLAPGTYHDTVIVTPVGWDEQPVKVPVTFNVRESPIRLAFLVHPSNAKAGSTISPSIQVVVRDATGKTVTGYSGSVTVELMNGTAGAKLSGTTTANVSSGIARFSNLNVDRVGSGYNLKASSGPLSVTSNDFNITPKSPSGSESTISADVTAIAASNGTIVARLTVTARDEDGVRLPDVPVAISVTGTGNRMIPSTGTTDDVGTFSTTFSSTKAETKTVTASVGGLAVTRTLNLTVTGAAATRMVFTVQPPPLVGRDDKMSPPVVVTLEDSFGNPASAYNQDVTVDISFDASLSRDARLRGDRTERPSNGVAIFDDLRVDRLGVGYTLVASAPGVPSVVSAPFNVLMSS